MNQNKLKSVSVLKNNTTILIKTLLIDDISYKINDFNYNNKFRKLCDVAFINVISKVIISHVSHIKCYK